jgi:hypothetical protein
MRILNTIIALTIGYIYPTFGQQTLFDIDLTKGSESVDSPSIQVLGGEWDNGWRVTDHQQRIILDPGKNIENGSLEVWYTIGKLPINPDSSKAQWVSLHEQGGGHAPEYAQLRTGRKGYGFSKLRAKSNEEGLTVKYNKVNNKRCEVKAGEITDWVTDDKTVMKTTIKWEDGVISFTTPDGKECACTKYWQYEPPYILNSLRYAYLGSDESENGAGLIGIRFKRVKYTDLGPSTP